MRFKKGGTHHSNASHSISAKGFLTLALSILDLLHKLALEKESKAAFLEPQMIHRLAAMLIHFFDSLCG